MIVECNVVKLSCCALNRMDPTIDYDIAEIKLVQIVNVYTVLLMKWELFIILMSSGSHN